LLQGDDGGQLVYQESDGIYTEFGILSFGSSAGMHFGIPFSLGSPATSTGFHQALALDLTKHSSRDKDSKAQTGANSN